MKSGDVYRNFFVTSCEEIPEIKSTLLEMEHKSTGASIMMIIHDDDENLFNISFQTCPSKSDGVAHILEHTVLCGSVAYPVKDPFFSMTRRSLNTFMNAFTGPDFTCYPAASQIAEDFYNLFSVYIDSVFHPLLSKNSFLQEGWRLEVVNREKKLLKFNGVVFNEMKGALMSGEARLSEALNTAIFPDVTYGVNSGGEPKDIVKLNRDTVRDFHEKYYSPGRAFFYFYGNIKPESHLDFLEEKILRGAEKADKPLPVPLQKRFKEPCRKHLFYPTDSKDEDKSLFGITWLTCSILDQLDLLGLYVIDLVLMGSDAALLKSELLRSGLCKQADSAIEGEIREIPFTVVCKGCSSDARQPLEDLIFRSLHETVKNGIPAHLIEGAIHQLELSRKEISGYSMPYGLSLFFRAGLLKQHGGNPSDGLKIHSLFANLRNKLAASDYLAELINKYLVDNKHFACILMEPDPDLISKENEEERILLEKIAETFEDQNFERVIQENAELEKFRNEKDDPFILPGISLEKIPVSGKEFSLSVEKNSSGNLLVHECFTNDLVFVDFVSDLPHVSLEELPWLRLLIYLLPQMGSGGRNYKQQLEFLLEHTGGIDIVYDFSFHAVTFGLIRPSLSIRGKVLAAKKDKLFQVFQDLIESTDWTDKYRIKELLLQHEESLTNSVRNSPMGYAVNLATSSLSSVAAVSYALSGLPYVEMIRSLCMNFESKIDEIIFKLSDLKNRCLGLAQPDLVLSCNRETVDLLAKDDFYGIFSVCNKDKQAWNTSIPLKSGSHEGLFIPSRAAFNALAFPLQELSYSHPDASTLCVLAEMLDNVVLHTKIREQGGAYGSGVSNNLAKGVFYFYSYRDPEIFNSYRVFLEAIEILMEGKFSELDLKEGILGVIQDLDTPVPPGGRAIVSYFRLRNGKTVDVRQKFRKALLNVTVEDIKSVARKYLFEILDRAIFVSFAGEEMLRKNAEEFDGNMKLSASLL